MIRIYLDELFELGQEISISQDEWHYLMSVRRNQGPVEAFNRRGQVARGSCKNKKFKIETVSQNIMPLYPVVIALAVPDREALSLSIRAASELGIEKIILFSGDRSQSAKNIEKSFEKLKKLALESMRQCARPQPLAFEWVSKIDNLQFESENIFFLDEDPLTESALDRGSLNRQNRVVAIVGPEGGWSPRERDIALARNWKRLHFDTPIMKVSTAVTVASFHAISLVSKMS